MPSPACPRPSTCAVLIRTEPDVSALKAGLVSATIMSSSAHWKRRGFNSSQRSSVPGRVQYDGRHQQGGRRSREDCTGRGRVERLCDGDVEITGNAGCQRKRTRDYKTRSNAMEGFRVFTTECNPMKRGRRHQQNDRESDTTQSDEGARSVPEKRCLDDRSWRWKPPTGAGLDLTPSLYWPAPIVAGEIEHDRGPVLVTIEY
jgi:hypothetical protein